MSIFGSVLIFACTLMHVYVFWRAGSVPLVRRHVPRKVLFGVATLLWVGLVLGRFFGHGGKGAFAVALELFGMTWMATLFLIFTSLLIADLVTGFGALFPRLAPAFRGWALAAGVVLSTIALIQGLRPPIVQDYEVYLSGMPDDLDGTVLVGMSDLHVGAILGENWLAARVSQVQALRPDMVVLLGDLAEGHGESRSELLVGLRGLSAPLGVWAVTGNHESHGSDRSGSGALEEMRIHLLSNRWTEVAPGLVLVGVDDLTANHRSGQGDDPLARALAGRPPSATILLSHTPWDVERAAHMGVGLMLCGHTHGGQLWPFGLLVRLRYPFVGGRYEVNGMTAIVCRGTGTWGPRMRLWRPSEIIRVTLRGEGK